jgi:ATP-dependent helicase Lhr and Lhr-like helicase
LDFGLPTSNVTALKSLLPRAWHPFLGRFNRPTRVQMEGIPSIMAGRPTLLISPTASGKTEAYAAPLAERIASGPDPRELSGWIVSPTRALVNDLARRLASPIAAMNLRVGRRTGEHREISTARPPHMVVTTPESLDSMLSRAPATFLNARFLVLDEVHMLDATPRGDHLACLVSRLRHISTHLQVIASSATIDDPAGLSHRYLGDDSQIVQATGDRPIDADVVPNDAGAFAEALVRMTRSGDVRKALVFVQRRADAERLFSVFRGRPPFGDAVFLHHGSLSRTRRETVERRMLTGTSGLCFATTTLEVGIDIGDIDVIVLAAPPPDVSTLLQRIGRGSRRRRVTRVCCLAADAGEALRYEHLLLCAREGRLLGGPYQFCPSVLVQQSMSLLIQTPRKRMSANALASRLPPWLAETEWTSRLPELLNRLLERGWLIGGSTLYSMGEKLEEAFERGRMHSNIDSGSDAVEVVDQDTRQVLGTLPRVAAGNRGLLLGGRRLKVSRRKSPSQILVTDTAARTDLTVPNRRGPVIHARLARDLARFAGIEPHAVPVIRLEDGPVALFHFMGSLWGGLLGVLMEKRTGMAPIGVNAFCMQLASLPETFPPEATADEIRSMAMRRQRKLRRNISEGGWVGELPPDWRRIHLMACLDIEGFLRTLREMVLTHDSIPSQPYDALVNLARIPWR